MTVPESRAESPLSDLHIDDAAVKFMTPSSIAIMDRALGYHYLLADRLGGNRFTRQVKRLWYGQSQPVHVREDLDLGAIATRFGRAADSNRRHNEDEAWFLPTRTEDKHKLLIEPIVVAQKACSSLHTIAAQYLSNINAYWWTPYVNHCADSLGLSSLEIHTHDITRHGPRLLNQLGCVLCTEVGYVPAAESDNNPAAQAMVAAVEHSGLPGGDRPDFFMDFEQPRPAVQRLHTVHGN